MLWTLPAAVRSLLVSSARVHARCSSAAAVTHAPLRILFCGSDEFSVKSLLALDKARQDTPGLIDEIHVAHRPAKATGRGLKVLREVPLSKTAAALSLPTHVFDTFTGFTPPFSYNLVIAVSFGLLVPPRILNLAHYGGLNVHPSLLPDLRGSAPIQHALLKRRPYTGVSVQTLHPARFDEGVVLAQTAAPGIEIGPRETTAELTERLADAGAAMLVRVLRERRFETCQAPATQGRDMHEQPSSLAAKYNEPTAWYTSSHGPRDYAPKITKQDRCIDFATMDMQHILAVQRALGDKSCLLPNGERLLVHDVVDTGVVCKHLPPGLALDDTVGGKLMFRAACGSVGIVKSSTYPGGARGKGNSKVAKILRDAAIARGR
ncbi:methionyl-tRNA formyltransferase [Didymella exigua CBS 183.55]|uniref:methionyl-tRNA formyltransferase n=1 Tax=Didymella exigua CBS 183.55 TaxID=1150837 RepID=A0A6A5RTI9_9PLEO|nr:methionyl-tRNA formyltransferase [Didymella exigua CBS 183.55]KAF1928687.1 methionyl-tRNA formyltransferase [Didymella exigua CBS 183.55]